MKKGLLALILIVLLSIVTLAAPSHLPVGATPDFAGDVSIAGALFETVTTFTGTDTLTVAEAGTILVSAGSAYTLTLPTASGNTGLRYHFIKTDANYNLITLDGDGSETFNYENSTGAPVLTYARLNTYCAEVTIVSDGSNWQVIDEAMGQVPFAHVYIDGNTKHDSVPDVTLFRIMLEGEVTDIGSNFTSAVWVNGTADGDVADHLQDDGEAQFVSGMVGGVVKNTDATTYAFITAHNDAGDLTLSEDLFPNGNEAYEIKYSKFVVPVSGIYSFIGKMAFANATVTAYKEHQARIHKNGTAIAAIVTQSSNIGPFSGHITFEVSCNKDDYIQYYGYCSGSTPNISGASVEETYFIVRLISKN